MNNYSIEYVALIANDKNIIPVHVTIADEGEDQHDRAHLPVKKGARNQRNFLLIENGLEGIGHFGGELFLVRWKEGGPPHPN